MPRSGRDDSRGWTARRVRASGSSIVLALAVVVLVLVARGMFVAASQPLGWLAAALAVVVVLTPIVEWLARWMPRGLAIALTLVVGAALVASVGVGLVMEIQDQLGQLGEELPEAAARLEDERGPESTVSQIGLASLVDDLVGQASERISPTPTIDDAVGTVPAFLVSGVLVVFLMVWGRSLFEGGLRQVSDPERRVRVEAVATGAMTLTQHYVVAAVGLGVAVAVAAGALAWWADLETPFVLGVVVGASSVIPYFGIVFGGVPMLLLAAAFAPVEVTVAVVAGLVVLQILATVVTLRMLERRALRAGPAVIIVMALVGSDVYGIGGALVAVVFGILAVAAVETAASEEEVIVEPPPAASPS